MAKILYFKKDEKLAMLKIMIDINNYYSERLPKAFKVIQNTAIFFNLPKGIAEAYAMQISTAKKILKKTFEDDFDKDEFFCQLLGHMLRTSDFGLVHKIKNYTYDDFREYKDTDRFSRDFRKEWCYVSELTRKILSSDVSDNIVKDICDGIDWFMWNMLIFDKKPLESDFWHIIDENGEIANSKISKSEDIKPNKQKQDFAKKKIQPKSDVHSNMNKQKISTDKNDSISNVNVNYKAQTKPCNNSDIDKKQAPDNKDASYSDIIKEILYKDL